MTTDAIVNAANSSLMGGGGVDGAIHRKGGPTIIKECIQIRSDQWPNGLPTGRAVITSGGNLMAKHVIHTVGPVWHSGNLGEAILLRDAYTNSLKLAVSSGLKTIAFPSISTGVYGYPIEEAGRIALATVKAFLEKEDRIEKLVVTNTIPVPLEKHHPKLEVLSIASLLAVIINDIHQGVSISEKLIYS